MKKILGLLMFTILVGTTAYSQESAVERYKQQKKQLKWAD